MNYHEEYKTDEEVSILRIEKVIYTKKSEYINNRALEGDEVLVDMDTKKVVQIVNRSRRIYVGILQLDSNTKYGSNKSGIPYYLCKPVQPTGEIFYVASARKERQKMYVRIELKEWKRTQRLPMGQIVDYIGKVGEEEVEYEMLRYMHEVDFPSYKMKKKIEEEEGEVDFEVFSIDPFGSKDIDDAFSFQETETHYEIGVHIANPSVFFDLTEWKNILEERVCTVYMPHRRCNMLPNEISENYASLIEGKRRRAITVMYQIRKSDHYVEFEIEEKWVKNRKNYVYEDVDKMIVKKKWDSTDIQHMYKVSKSYFECDEMDSHQFVEKWMIQVNHDVATHCTFNFGLKTVLRVCPSPSHSGFDQMDFQLQEYLKRGEMKGAEYQYYQEGTYQGHDILGLTYYTHFTSPIRRSIDFYTHLLLRGIDEITIDLNKVNERMKKMKKFDRDLRRMKFLFEHSEETSVESEGYVVEMNEESMRIFMPKYNLEEKIMLKDRMGYSEVEGKEMEVYQLYEKVKVDIFIFVKEEYIRNKIRIRINKL